MFTKWSTGGAGMLPVVANFVLILSLHSSFLEQFKVSQRLHTLFSPLCAEIHHHLQAPVDCGWRTRCSDYTLPSTRKREWGRKCRALCNNWKLWDKLFQSGNYLISLSLSFCLMKLLNSGGFSTIFSPSVHTIFPKLFRPPTPAIIDVHNLSA